MYMPGHRRQHRTMSGGFRLNISLPGHRNLTIILIELPDFVECLLLFIPNPNLHGCTSAKLQTASVRRLLLILGTKTTSENRQGKIRVPELFQSLQAVYL